MILNVEVFLTFTLAIAFLFVGKILTMRSPMLREYSIPEPVTGGIICAVGVALVYYVADIKILFDLSDRDELLLYFFAAVGLRADLRTLIAGGKPLAILLLAASVFIVLQNITGVSVATLFGMEPLVGVIGGSVSLVGGVGTTVAWAPIFEKDFGITNANEIGIACNTLGLILACLMGGPIAKYLISRHKLTTGSHETLDVGVAHDKQEKTEIDYLAVLYAWLWLNLTLIMGYFINIGIQQTGLQMPEFVSCLIAGIIINNTIFNWFPRIIWPGSDRGLALLSDLCLGMFLTMALMSMQFWALAGVLGFVLVLMLAQALLSLLYTLFVVFRFMGKDYEAAVMSAGFGGITLGSTATAVANMTAVTQQYGAAHRAMIVVPLVCGFFIDIVNALIINLFVSL